MNKDNRQELSIPIYLNIEILLSHYHSKGNSQFLR